MKKSVSASAFICLFVLVSCVQRRSVPRAGVNADDGKNTILQASLQIQKSSPIDIATLKSSVSVDLGKAFALSKANVVIADYGVIRHDFPGLKNRSESEIDSWLLGSAAYIESKQANEAAVGKTNQKIPLTPVSVVSYRPIGYGRALVYQTDQMDDESKKLLIEVKGAGSVNPKYASHGNGLASLTESLREYHYDKITQLLLAHMQRSSNFVSLPERKVQNVPVYAVISAGFNLKDADGKWSPAGLIVRRSHLRKGEFTTQAGTPLFSNPKILGLTKDIELGFRQYGLTTAVFLKASQWTPEDSWDVNVQYSANLDVIDYGSYLGQQSFDQPLLFLHAMQRGQISDDQVRAQPSLVGTVNLTDVALKLDTNSDGFVKFPTPGFALDPTTWRKRTDKEAKGAFVDNISYLSEQVQGNYEFGNLKAADLKELKEKAKNLHCRLIKPQITKLKFEGDLTSTAGCL